MSKRVLRKFGAIKRFKDLQPGDPLFMINPHELGIIEAMVYNVKHWDDKRNVSGEAIEVIFYKPVVNIDGIDVEKLKTAHKEFDVKVHKTLIVKKDLYLVITHEHIASIPVPMCTDKTILKAWIRGEAI